VAGLEQDYNHEINLLDSNHAMQRALRKASMERHGKAHQIMLESVSKEAERRERQAREAAMEHGSVCGVVFFVFHLFFGDSGSDLRDTDTPP